MVSTYGDHALNRPQGRGRITWSGTCTRGSRSAVPGYLLKGDKFHVGTEGVRGGEEKALPGLSFSSR